MMSDRKEILHDLEKVDLVIEIWPYKTCFNEFHLTSASIKKVDVKIVMTILCVYIFVL